MKNTAVLFSLLLLPVLACVPRPSTNDAKTALDAAVAACAFRDSLPKQARDACDKLDAAADATRDAAEAVLAIVPKGD